MPGSMNMVSRIIDSLDSPRRWLLRICAIATALLTAAGASTAVHAAIFERASAPLTFYGVGSAEQFLDHSDDRARGEGNNPFGTFADTPAVAEPGSTGPFAGDQAVYKILLYR